MTATPADMVVVPKGAALVIRYPAAIAPDKLAADRRHILDILGPDTRVLLVSGDVGVHVFDDGARALVDAALTLHQANNDPCGYLFDEWPCPTARALGVES